MTAAAFEHAPAVASTAKISGSTIVILAILAAVLALVGAAILIGPVVLTLAALVLVPVMFALFIAISRP